MTRPPAALQERLVNIVRRFSDQKITIFGDTIADKFLFGSISRVSREAPVFILRHQRTETLPGGAANCAIECDGSHAARPMHRHTVDQVAMTRPGTPWKR